MEPYAFRQELDKIVELKLEEVAPGGLSGGVECFFSNVKHLHSTALGRSQLFNSGYCQQGRDFNSCN